VVLAEGMPPFGGCGGMYECMAAAAGVLV